MGKSIWTGKRITLVLGNAVLGSMVCGPGILWDIASVFALNGLDVSLFHNFFDCSAITEDTGCRQENLHAAFSHSHLSSQEFSNEKQHFIVYILCISPINKFNRLTLSLFLVIMFSELMIIFSVSVCISKWSSSQLNEVAWLCAEHPWNRREGSE